MSNPFFLQKGTFPEPVLMALLVKAWNKGLELHTLRRRALAHRFCGNATRLLQRLVDGPVKARYSETISAGVSSFATNTSASPDPV